MTEEFKDKINKIIDHCKVQSDIYNNYQMGTKILINSIYGAFGFNGFYFYNKNIAESVTKQGKNVILYAENLLNKWAKKVWLKDEKTHKLMGIKIKDNTPITENISVYIDTDSLVKDSIINILDEVVIIETETGKQIFNKNDKVKICRCGVEMEIEASNINKDDLINV